MSRFFTCFENPIDTRKTFDQDTFQPQLVFDQIEVLDYHSIFNYIVNQHKIKSTETIFAVVNIFVFRLINPNTLNVMPIVILMWFSKFREGVIL